MNSFVRLTACLFFGLAALACGGSDAPLERADDALGLAAPSPSPSRNPKPTSCPAGQRDCIWICDGSDPLDGIDDNTCSGNWCCPGCTNDPCASTGSLPKKQR